MSMYNLIEYSKNYRKTTGSLRNYYRDELSDDTSSTNGLKKNVIESKSFKYKTSITGSSIDYNVSEKVTNAEGNEVSNPAYDANKIDLKEAEFSVPLKYFSNFWKTLNMPLINCEVSLILTWSKNCVLTTMKTGATQENNPAIAAPTNPTFKTTDTKLYVPVITLSTQDDNKLLEQL